MTEQLSNNPLVRDRQEGEAAYRDLIEHDAQAAAHLQELAVNIYRETAHLAALREASALKVGGWIADAYATLGNKHNSFTAWWDDPGTWEKASGLTNCSAPIHRTKAQQIKRLADFCSGDIVGNSVGRNKNPEGFTDEALLELTSPKYVKDKQQQERVSPNGRRTDESQARLDVVEKAYQRLRRRARDRALAAQEKGVDPAPITKKEVVEVLQDEFKAAGMVLVHRAVRRTSLKDMLVTIERLMVGWYYTFEGNTDAINAMRDKVAECLDEWTALEG